MNIIITGASGFIGQNLIKKIVLKECKYLTISRKKKIKFSVNHLSINLNDFIKNKKKIIDFNPDVIIHLAWQNIPDYSEKMSFINLNLSINFLSFIINSTNCKKIIVSGSCWEYGKIKGPCKETDNLSINSYFSLTKNMLYNYLNYTCKINSINLVWFRIFYVYGYGQKKISLIPSIVTALSKNKSIEINYPYYRNDYINIDDVVKVFIYAIFNKIKPGIYNLGNGKTNSVIDIFKIIESKIIGNSDFSNEILNKNKKDKSVNFWANKNKLNFLLNSLNFIDIKTGIHNYIDSNDNF